MSAPHHGNKTTAPDGFRDDSGVKNGLAEYANRHKMKIPYSPNEIVVEKHPGMRTASAFCSSRALRSKLNPAPRSKLNSMTESEKSDPGGDVPSSASSVLQLSCDSDHSDTMSFVSDISELSMLSDLRFDHLPRVPIAGVHGSSNVRVQIKRLNEQLAMVKSENDEYQKQALFVTGHRQELFQLKSRNFGLQRENTNLQSQLKSAQEMCESLRAAIEQIQEKRKSEALTPKLPLDIHCKSDCKSKLRVAHDEIFRLQTELTERKLEVKGKCDEATRLRNRCVTLETSLDEASRNLETSNRCRASSEQALQILQSEKESFVKSRDWYRDQMRLAQEARASLQRELTLTQKDSSSRIEKLQLEIARSKVELEEERVGSLKEKEELKGQLEDLVVLERDRLVQSSSSTRSDQDQFRECEAEVARMSEIVHSLKSELILTTSKLQEKSGIIVKLRSEIVQLEETNSNLEKCQEESKKQLDEAKVSLVDRESIVRNLEQCISELRSTSARDRVQIDQLKEEAEILRQNLENVSRDKISTKVELEGQLRTCENELIRYKEQYNLLQKDFEVFGKEMREKIFELESKNEKLKRRFETKEEESLVISELLESAAEREHSLAEERQKLEELLSASEEKIKLLENSSKIKSSEYEEKIKMLEHEKSTNSSEFEEKIKMLEHAEKLKLSEFEDKIKMLENDERLKMSEYEERIKMLESEKSLQLENADSLRLEHLMNESQNEGRHNNDVIQLESPTLQNGDVVYDVTNEDKVCQLETMLEESLNTIDMLQNKNTDLAHQLEAARCRIEELDKPQEDEAAAKAAEDLRSLQARKIVRLECSVAVFEAEVSHLSSAIADLEEQVLRLEQENGRLVVEAGQNSALKGQIKQLQEDIKKDTDLRRELISAVQVARSSLMTEIVDLENGLHREKEMHNATKTKLLNIQHQMASDRENLKNEKVNASTMTSIFVDSGNVASPVSDFATVQAELESAKMTISRLEDQVRELSLRLEELKAESESQLEVASGRCDRQELELVEARGHCKALRSEILELTKRADAISDEKNSYRSQVQDMNTALKNSLEHIKRLRTRASVVNYRSSPSAAGSPTTTSPLPPPLSPTHSLDEMLIVELLNSTPNANKNLSNLQNCLASLKSEMVVLQTKLAPSSISPSHQRRQRTRDSKEATPEQSQQNSPRK